MNRLAWGTAVLVLLALPHVLRVTQAEFVIEIFIYGMFATSLNILIGRLGLISFGHGLFLGVGAYLAAFQLTHLSQNLFVLLLAAVLLGAVVALAVGALVLRLGGVGFVMITIALCQLFYVLILSTQDVTGGVNGLSGLPRPTLGLAGVGPDWLSLDSTATFYYVSLVCLAVFLLALRRLDASPMGMVFHGIRQNPARMRALGYPVRLFQLAGFIMAGVGASVAGALSAGLLGVVDPTLFFWTTSGEVILMVILGGSTVLLGPLVGAAIFITLFHQLSGITDHWRLVLGLIFVFVVLFAPRGVLPVVCDRWRAWRTPRQRAAEPGSIAPALGRETTP